MPQLSSSARVRRFNLSGLISAGILLLVVVTAACSSAIDADTVNTAVVPSPTATAPSTPTASPVASSTATAIPDVDPSSDDKAGTATVTELTERALVHLKELPNSL